MNAIVLNATLKASPEESSTEALGAVVVRELEQRGVTCEQVRLVDLDILPGVRSDEGEGDAWPALRERILDAEILVLATPTWLGQPSSVAKRALERMDAFLSEADDAGVPVAYNRVAGFVVTGNEDGAHQCIALMAQALIDIGFTVPGQAWTYWNKGPGPGEEVYLTTAEREWTDETAAAMAHVLVAVAAALAERPIPRPPNA